jgi:hypothetical protein
VGLLRAQANSFGEAEPWSGNLIMCETSMDYQQLWCEESIASPLVFNLAPGLSPPRLPSRRRRPQIGRRVPRSNRCCRASRYSRCSPSR